jgi:hypothetical protein
MHPLTLKGDKEAVSTGICRRGRNDATLGYGLDRERSTDAAEVLAIEKIGFAILAQRED